MPENSLNAGEKGGDLLPKLVRPGALRSDDQRRALRAQAGKTKSLLLRSCHVA